MKTPERTELLIDVPLVHVYEVDEEVNADVSKMMLHSDTYYFDNPVNVWDKQYSELEKLFESIVFAVRNYAQLVDPSTFKLELDGWCVTTPASNTHMIKHHHADHADIVAIYYAVNDNSFDQGAIVLFNERDEQILQHSPLPRQLLLFPGNWNHQVLPYTGARLSIATNVRVHKTAE